MSAPPVALDLCVHNETEGTPTEQTVNSDIALLCETDHKKVRAAFAGTHHVFLPEKDSHNAIALRKSLFQNVTHKSIKIHGSATGTPDIPDNVPTPARWVHVVAADLINRNGDVIIRCSFIVSHWIQSWDPPPGHADFSTPTRKRLAKMARKAMAKAIRAERKKGHLVFAGGDLNATRKTINFRGLEAAKQSGLDRLFWTKGLTLAKKIWEGPKTGVGGQMYHNSVHADLRLDRAKIRKMAKR